jgi:hypothetical protein
MYAFSSYRKPRSLKPKKIIIEILWNSIIEKKTGILDV